MIRRVFSAIVLLWALGFLWFGLFLTPPAGNVTTDAVVVPTGGAGRIDRGLMVLRNGRAEKMLVTGVDPEVRPEEFEAQYEVPPQLMECCVTLGFAAADTRGNAREAADWLEANEVKTVRLVTSDWHMPRAAFEMDSRLPEGVTVIEDGVPTDPQFVTLFIEYNKLLATALSRLAEKVGLL